MTGRSPLPTAGKPPPTSTASDERAQCRDRTSRGNGWRATRRETKEDDVPGHVRCENVTKTQKADRIDETGHDRQPDERSNKRSLIIHDFVGCIHVLFSAASMLDIEIWSGLTG